jgi:hypothetical protein
MPGSQRNTRLRELYLDRWAALEGIVASGEDVSAPFLPWVHPDYDRAAVRLVVVGKETNGWGDHPLAGRSPAEAVETLMGEYRDFALGTRYQGAVAYWTPVHELYQALNPNGATRGFVALNASVVDQGGDTPNPELQAAIIGTGLLPEEIRILEPDVVVFHTGPAYETWLDGWFPGLHREGDSMLAQLTAPGLPALTFRTYHPRYLNYRSMRSAVYARIVDAVHESQ